MQQLLHGGCCSCNRGGAGLAGSLFAKSCGEFTVTVAVLHAAECTVVPCYCVAVAEAKPLPAAVVLCCRSVRQHASRKRGRWRSSAHRYVHGEVGGGSVAVAELGLCCEGLAGGEGVVRKEGVVV